MFHVIDKEIQWRKDHGRSEGFDTLRRSKPIVAVGEDEPLGGERMKAAYYRMFPPILLSRLNSEVLSALTKDLIQTAPTDSVASIAA